MQSSSRVYTLPFSDIKTYLVATLFIIGNILLPQLCHLIPNGGHILLPIYFFTLIGAYKYGWKVGLLTAVLSPLINMLLFGMPAPAVLPSILIKSILLATLAGYAATRSPRATLITLAGIILGYQILGSAAESLIESSLTAGLTDFRLGLPGMLLQLFGAHLLLRRLP